jgi:hypothetical protein
MKGRVTISKQPIRSSFMLTCFAVLFAAAPVVTAQGQGTPTGAVASIPETEITTLRQEIAGFDTRASEVKKRRACKVIIRKGNSLVEANPTAPNRYRVLAIVYQTQIRLLALDNSDRNREALFKTCATLAKAPDAYAKLRLQADFLLMDRDMSGKKADVKVRAVALAELIARYRNTPAEAKSLMMAAIIAPKLEAFELEKKINQAMDERFAGDMDLLEWKRTHRNYAHFKLIFKGTFTRIDGTTLTFPYDGMGHTCVMFFWSEKSPGLEKQMLAMKKLQSQFANQFKVFSFNVDELPDGGGKTLKRLGLDWTVMRLTGGKNSQIYRVYAGQDLVALRVNAHGHALLPSNLVRTMVDEMPMEQDLDELRYLSQLQSLLIGDFLIADINLAKQSKSIPAEVITAIQDCFTPAPFRYRITEAESLANYQKAERLSLEAIARFPDAPDLWRVRNCRIIALLGMWNLGIEPKHLEAAVVESQTALTAKPPQGADLVPQFCLTKNALRQSNAKPDSILESFIKTAGKDDASANAAACILAMDANSRELHQNFRAKLLALKPTNPALWPVISFLRDQNHRFRLFQANFYLPPSRARRVVRGALRLNATDLKSIDEKRQLLKAEFNTLTGGKLTLPKATDGKLTLLMFIEPSADPNSDFPVEINGSVTVDTKGKKRETLGIMQHAFEMAEQDPSKSIKVIAAFLSDDKTSVQALMKKHPWPCQSVMVPGGLKNPLVRKLGIISADRTPNIFLLRPDGTVVWSISGIIHPQHKSEGIGEFTHAIRRAMKTHIQLQSMAGSLDALKQGKFMQAVNHFSGPLPLDRRDQDGWLPPQLHGRALAYIGLKDWKNALTDIDAAILIHNRIYSRKIPCHCDRTAKLQRTKAMILEKLGQSDDAQQALKRASSSTITHPESRYGLYHDQLDTLAPLKTE